MGKKSVRVPIRDLRFPFQFFFSFRGHACGAAPDHRVPAFGVVHCCGPSTVGLLTGGRSVGCDVRSRELGGWLTSVEW